MGRLLLLTGLVALLLLASAATAQGPIKTRGHRPPAQDREGAAGTLREAPPAGLLVPEDDNPLLLLLPGLKLMAGGQQGGRGPRTLEDKDILGHLRRPLLGPEPDSDHRYHPASPEAREQEPRPQAPLARQVLQGPEQDRDHIHHASGHAWPSPGQP